MIAPVDDPLPYGRQAIDDDDVAAVVAALRSDWLTTGPLVPAFEQQFADRAGTACAVAFSSGTAALHGIMASLGIGPGDEVIVPTLTFAASANSVAYLGARPVFADVCEKTLLLDPTAAERLVTPRTRAIVAVDYAGQPCDYDALIALADRHGLPLVADACHSLGATWHGRPVGGLAHCTAFSFHPVKAITTGEGGMVTTDDEALADSLRRFRNHGIAQDVARRNATGTWQYDMVELGFNYRLTDIQCALGMSQLNKLDRFIQRRHEIAAAYDSAFADISRPATQTAAGHAHHLYVLRVADRDRVFTELRGRAIGVNVHYRPVHLHPYYREQFGTEPGLCPKAESAFRELISLPIYPGMTDADVERVIRNVTELVDRAPTHR